MCILYICYHQIPHTACWQGQLIYILYKAVKINMIYVLIQTLIVTFWRESASDSCTSMTIYATWSNLFQVAIIAHIGHCLGPWLWECSFWNKPAPCVWCHLTAMDIGCYVVVRDSVKCNYCAGQSFGFNSWNHFSTMHCNIKWYIVIINCT